MGPRSYGDVDKASSVQEWSVSKSVKVRQYAEEAMAPGQRSLTKGSSISRIAASVPGGRADNASPAVRDSMLTAVPHLRAFAISFCGNVGRADDFVQETLLRALANINSFQPGTNVHSWLFTILCNLIRSYYQKRRREVEDADGGYPDNLKSLPEQHGRLELEEVRVALTKLPSTQREALLLVGASGFSYAEAAEICETAIGTVKSRVNRARTRLSELIALDSPDRLGPDPTKRAVLTAGGRG
jgi:RNA polymerase sigma-70 factor, ECF subfamily